MVVPVPMVFSLLSFAVRGSYFATLCGPGHLLDTFLTLPSIVFAIACS